MLLLSAWLFDERLTPWRWLGSAAIGSICAWRAARRRSKRTMPGAWAEVPPTLRACRRAGRIQPLTARAPLRPPASTTRCCCARARRPWWSLNTLAQRSAARAWWCRPIPAAGGPGGGAPGLRLRLCDLAPDRLDFDADSLRRACNEDTLAVVPTHLGGRVADVATAAAVARAAGAWVIEDAADLGRPRRRRARGASGGMAFFSLAVGGASPCTEGGVLTARNAAATPARRRRRAGAAAARLGMGRSPRTAGLPRPVPSAAAYWPIGWPAPARAAPWRLDPRRRRLRSARPLCTRSAPGAGAWGRMARRWPAYADALRARHSAACRCCAMLPGTIVFDDAPGTCGAWPCGCSCQAPRC